MWNGERARALVLKTFIARLFPMYRDTCQVQAAAESDDTMGSGTNSWTAVSGLEAVPCQVDHAQEREVRTQTGTYTIDSPAVRLAGYFPQITRVMRAVVTDKDGNVITYNILGVQHGPLRTKTSLPVEVVQ